MNAYAPQGSPRARRHRGGGPAGRHRPAGTYYPESGRVESLGILTAMEGRQGTWHRMGPAHRRPPSPWGTHRSRRRCPEAGAVLTRRAGPGRVWGWGLDTALYWAGLPCAAVQSLEPVALIKWVAPGAGPTEPRFPCASRPLTLARRVKRVNEYESVPASQWAPACPRKLLRDVPNQDRCCALLVRLSDR